MAAAATPAAMTSTTTNPTMKIIIDTKAQRVLFAEAGKDVADFLLGLLALPLGAVAKVLGRESMATGVANLYTSVAEMDDAYMQAPRAAKDALLNPTPSFAAPAGGHRSLPLPPPPPAATADAEKTLSDVGLLLSETQMACTFRSFPLPPPQSLFYRGGSGWASTESLFYRGGGAVGNASEEAHGSGGYVRGIATFTVMDDLTINPVREVSLLAMLNASGVKDVGALEERTVELGYEEGLGILKSSLKSNTVLTDVFLTKEGRVHAPAGSERRSFRLLQEIFS